MARAISTRQQIASSYSPSLGTLGLLIFFPILWTILTSFKTEAERDRRSAVVLQLRLDAGELYVVQERSDYFALLVEFGRDRGRLHALGADDRGPGGLVDGLRAGQAHQGRADVDAVDQDAAAGGCADPDLAGAVATSACSTAECALVVILTLINLPIIVWMLYTYFKEIPGEILEAARMDGATLRDGDHLRADADGGAGDRLDAAARTSSWPGTRRSGR